MSAFEVRDGSKVSAPALRRRFPLSRLAYVQTDASARPTGTTNAITQKYFGLIKATDSGADPSGAFTWEYRDADGGKNKIKTLKEVAAQNRDPNFFEILKSVISVGSLGQSKQVVNTATTSMEPRANVIDEHILRIGAAIIDQADVDSYPTRIHFNYNSGNGLGEIYGVEDLPYLYSVRFMGYANAFQPPGVTEDTYQKTILAQMGLWNPHDPSRSLYNVASTPSKFRVTAQTILAPIIIGPALGWANMESGFIFSDSPGADTGADVAGGINFSWNATGQNFRQPQGLLSNSYPTGANPSGPSYAILAPNENPIFLGLSPQPYPDSTYKAYGFKIFADKNPVQGTPANRRNVYLPFDAAGGALVFTLKYEAGGNYYAYDHIWFCPNATPTDAHDAELNHPTFVANNIGRGNPIAPVSATLRRDAAIFKTDPRSQRFIWATDNIRFTGPSPAINQTNATPEGLGLGWFDGLWGTTGMSPSTGVPLILLTDQTNRPGWILGAHYSGTNPSAFRSDIGLLAINKKVSSSGGLSYADSDGVVRRGMAGLTFYSTFSNSYPASSKFTSTSTTGADGKSTMGRPMQASVGSNNNFYKSRPIVLNRPFRSVGELANAFRDVPWKNVDFSFPESADTGLLDVFSVYESEDPSDAATPLVAGKVNLNVAPQPVLQALLQGAARQIPPDTSSTSSPPSPPPLDWKTTVFKKGNSDLTNLVTRISNYRSTAGGAGETNTSVNGPLRSLAELVGRPYPKSGGGYSNSASFVGLQPFNLNLTSPNPSSYGTDEDKQLQERLSAVARSLADSGSVRSWNFMIDLVAQSGKVNQNASLDKFTVASESRWWMFVSIDRFTGKVIARSVERVVE